MKTIKLIVLCLLVILSQMALASIPSKDLFISRTISNFKINPDSKYAALYRQTNKHAALELLDVKSMDHYEIMTFPDNARLEDYQWVDRDTLYIEFRNNRKVEAKGFIDITFDGEKPKVQLTHIKAPGNVLDTLPNLEDQLLFAKRTGDDLDDIEIYTATTKQVAKNKFKRAKEFDETLDDAFYYIADSQGEVIMAVTYEEETFFYWVLDKNTNEWTKVHKIFNLDYEFSPIGLFTNGNIAVLTNKESDLVSLYEFDIKTKKLVKLLYQHPVYDLVGATIDNDTDSVESVAYVDHGKISFEFLSLEDKKVIERLRKEFPGKQIVIESKNEKTGLMVVNVFASDDPGKYYLFDKTTKQTKLIGHEVDSLADYEFTRSKVFIVKSTGGQNIEAILTRPKDNNSVLLVEPHGGPIGVRDYDLFSRSTQYFASRGFSVLKVNFRGSEGYGKKFKNAGRGQFGKAIEEDISAAVKQAVKQHKFDKICAMGTSYGGYSSMMLGIYNPEVYNCIIGAYGVYDLPLLFNSSNIKTSEKHKEKVRRIVGEESVSLENYSPINFAEKVSQPVLLIAGKKDAIAGFEQTNRMKYRLKQLDKDVDWLYYDGVGHGHSKWYGDRHQHAYMHDFLVKQLGLENRLTEDNRKILETELMMLSDSYSFDDFVEDDAIKALGFLRRAAEFGNARAMFNIGASYHRGEGVEKSMDEAVAWYEKASKAGMGEASYRLGFLKTKDEQLATNLETPMDYFVLGEEQDNKKARLEVAEAYCLAKGFERDVIRCFKLLETVDHKNKKAFKRVHKMVTEGLWSDTLDEKSRSEAIESLKKIYKVNAVENFSFLATEVGVFEDKERSWKEGKYYYVDKDLYNYDYDASDITLDDVTLFGIHYQLKVTEEIKSPKTLVKVRWTHPELHNPKSKLVETELKRVAVLKAGHGAQSIMRLDKHWMKAEGQWKLEVFSLQDKLLFSQIFDVREDH